MIKRLIVGVSFLMLGAFGLQAQSSSTQSGSQSGSQQQYGTQQPGSQQGDQPATQSNSQGSNQLSRNDQDFVKKAYQGNMSEIQLGQLATQKASNSDVKQFAQQMVDDHTKANDQLRQIAESKGITLPSDTQNANAGRFQNLSGTNFDRQYIQNQMQAHRQAVSLFKNEANNGQDPDLKSFASTQLSNLQQHESMISDLHSKVTSSARSNQPGNLPRSSTYSGSSSSSQSPDQAQSNPSGSSSDTYSSSSTSSSTTTKNDMASNKSGSQLPRTASNIPLAGLFGFMLIGAALIIRSFRSLRSTR